MPAPRHAKSTEPTPFESSRKALSNRTGYNHARPAARALQVRQAGGSRGTDRSKSFSCQANAKPLEPATLPATTSHNQPPLGQPTSPWTNVNKPPERPGDGHNGRGNGAHGAPVYPDEGTEGPARRPSRPGTHWKLGHGKGPRKGNTGTDHSPGKEEEATHWGPRGPHCSQPTEGSYRGGSSRYGPCRR
jgi:hypothetical protein